MGTVVLRHLLWHGRPMSTWVLRTWHWVHVDGPMQNDYVAPWKVTECLATAAAEP